MRPGPSRRPSGAWLPPWPRPPPAPLPAAQPPRPLPPAAPPGPWSGCRAVSLSWAVDANRSDGRWHARSSAEACMAGAGSTVRAREAGGPATCRRNREEQRGPAGVARSAPRTQQTGRGGRLCQGPRVRPVGQGMGGACARGRPAPWGPPPRPAPAHAAPVHGASRTRLPASAPSSASQ